VANGAELVGYSGFSTTNFLEQPYNSALDFGTGDFCVMGWHKSSGSNNNADIFARGTILAQTDDRLIRLIRWANGRYAFGVSRIGIGGDGVEYQAGNVTNWAHIACIRKNSQLELWFDGRLVASGPSTIDTSQPGAVLRLGHYVYSMVGSAALWRISATAPTPDQIAKIYEDERKLFMPGAACTLYGTSDAVTAPARGAACSTGCTVWPIPKPRSPPPLQRSMASSWSNDDMSVTISKPAVNLREELAVLRAKVTAGAMQEAFWFSGDGSTTSFALSRGWAPKFVFVDGALKRPGPGEDYTVSYDGFIHSLVFAVAPAAVDIGVICVREM
jgi:hypothetical protein